MEWGEYGKKEGGIKLPAVLGGFVSVEEVYVPLAHFLRERKGKTPFFIGITGGVSAGKTSAGRILQGLFGELGFSVELVSTDGFLYPNQKLQALGLMERKGFPESYDLAAMHSFCLAIREKRPVRLPIYDHAIYDPMAEPRDIGTAEIFILDGLHLPLERFFGSLLDFSLYLDADEKLLWQWYLQRFLELSAKGKGEPSSYYHRFATLSEKELREKAEYFWREINLVNLKAHILPLREGADMVLQKGECHAVQNIILQGDLERV